MLISSRWMFLVPICFTVDTFPIMFKGTEFVAQYVVNYSSSILGFESSIKCNEYWWVGKNGQMYFKYQRLGYQRYVYNNSYQIAKQAIIPVKNLAKGLSGASIFLDAAEVAIDKEVKPSNIISTTVAVFALIPGCEWIPIVYGIVDISSLVLTGESLGDKANNYWGTIK